MAELTPAERFAKEFTLERREVFLQNVRNGMQRGAACDAVFGENNPTRRRLMRGYVDSDDEFREMVEDAEVDATEHVREALYQAGVSGNVGAAKTWLEMQGVAFPEHRGRPSRPRGDDEESDDAFGDLGNVAVLDPRVRHRQRDS